MPRKKGTPKTGGRKNGSVNGATVKKFSQSIESVKLTIERVLQEYACLATLDISQAFGPDGNYLPIHQMPEAVRRCIAGLEVADLNIDNDGKGSVGRLHKLKFYDKRAALADIAKHLGMFIERIGNPDGTALQPHTIRFIEVPKP